MPHIAVALIPLITAADNLTEQARDLLQLHRQEVPRSFSVIATLEAAMDTLDEARDALEQS
jgi:GTP1/Obg family GTP-binding protein